MPTWLHVHREEVVPCTELWPCTLLRNCSVLPYLCRILFLSELFYLSSQRNNMFSFIPHFSLCSVISLCILTQSTANCLRDYSYSTRAYKHLYIHAYVYAPVYICLRDLHQANNSTAGPNQATQRNAYRPFHIGALVPDFCKWKRKQKRKNSKNCNATSPGPMHARPVPLIAKGTIFHSAPRSGCLKTTRTAARSRFTKVEKNEKPAYQICLLPHDFSNMTNDQKEIWGNKCAVSWPCKVKCIHLQISISNHVSPVRRSSIVTHVNQSKWSLYDATCSAPKFYSGPCLSRASLLSLDKDMKVAFEKLCKVDFPCLLECEMDENDVTTEEIAIGSSNRMHRESPLAVFPQIIIPDLSKESTAYDCDIQWPCIHNTLNVINYEEFCPENWIKSES
ncbi:CPW-WPC family protein, partial [Plasmodium ovale curtisi]